MRLPLSWEIWLDRYIGFKEFYAKLDEFVSNQEPVIPDKSLIFNVFHRMRPEEVNCVLFGEDPYPRITSANGIAFWDQEIQSWNDKTNGNSLKNILKAILISKNEAVYNSSINQCRETAERIGFKTPPELFESWLGQGVFLVNVSLTFSSAAAKKAHFDFWKPFHSAVIHSLNVRTKSPYYILWGRKAQKWEETILKTIAQPSKIIRQGHPTFIHQFLNPAKPDYSPFTELQKKTGIIWE
jgi:uracil-DNA glycosylase